MKLGYIGLGVMGSRMAMRLVEAGHELTVWNRDRDKARSLVAKGARLADTPAALARAAEIVMLCVTDDRAEQEVLLGKDGVVHGIARGALLVDFSSIPPESARSFSRRFLGEGVGYLDAPVSGGTRGAENGTLVIMAGGRPEDVERARPVLAPLAARVTRMGDSGAGQATKLCNQIIVGSLIPVIAEAVRLAEAAGVDAKMLPEALKGGFADSGPLQVFGARMAARSFEPPIGTCAILLKDLDNAAALAKSAAVPLPMAHAAAELYRMQAARGGAGRDASTLIELLS
jgi:3-hydroxyisobutyrate dehydrogenase-like beta-hydroxyacid dehydrogenase